MASNDRSPGSLAGGFDSGKHVQCTATSKRRRAQCHGVAVTDTNPPRCRMHGGTALATQGGAKNHMFTDGRHSKVLKGDAKLSVLYSEALSNPDLISMVDHFALLESRMHQVLGRAIDGSPAPEWTEFVQAVGDLEDAWVKEDKKRTQAAIKVLHAIVESGSRWDSTWQQVTGLIDHMRKISETETKRKKDLGMMIPIERVVALMAAVGHSVKARVSNVEEVQAVFRDLTRLHGGPQLELAATIDIPPATLPDDDSLIDEIDEEE